MDNPRRVWLISYWADSPNITHTMLHAQGIMADECYTLERREVKFTLINVPRRARPVQMYGCMERLRVSDSVNLQQVDGYAALCGFYGVTDELIGHPGFRLIVQRLESVHVWLQYGDMYTNRMSLLCKFAAGSNVSNLTKGRLGALVTDLKRKYAAVSEQNEELVAELAERDRQLSEADETIRRLRQNVVDLQELYDAVAG